MAKSVFVVVDVLDKKTGVHIFSLVPIEDGRGDFINTQSTDPILVPGYEMSFSGGDTEKNSATIHMYNSIDKTERNFDVKLTPDSIPFDIIFEDSNKIVDAGCVCCEVPEVNEYDSPEVKQQKENQRVENLKAAIWAKLSQRTRFYNNQPTPGANN